MECFTGRPASRVAIHRREDTSQALFAFHSRMGPSGAADAEPLLTVARAWSDGLADRGGGTSSLGNLIGAHYVWEIIATHRDGEPLPRPPGLPAEAFHEAWVGPQGGVAMIRIGKPGAPVAARLGVAQHAHRDGSFCGDGWAVAAGPDRVTALVLDGLGHSPIAATAAGAGIEAFLLEPDRPLQATAAALHVSMAATVGGVGALASFVPAQGQVEFLGLGDISGRLIDPNGATRGLASDPGTFGVRQPRWRVFPYQAERHLLVLHTDGVRERWRLNDYPGLRHVHPALIAALLHRDLARESDDGTVLVLDLAAF